SYEIEKLHMDSRKPEDQPTIKLVFNKGEPVTIKEGPFQGYEGTVDELLPEKGLVRVLVTIFGRQAPIEIEEWQLGTAGQKGWMWEVGFGGWRYKKRTDAF